MKRYHNTNPIKHITRIITKYVDKNEYKIFLFGSRANNTHHEGSDYDIGIKGPKKLPHRTLLKLYNDFLESPYQVDIIDFSIVDKDFKNIAEKYILELG